MSERHVFSDVAVSVQSALATAVAISAISQADPAVVTHAGTGPTNGQLVVLKVSGMTEVNLRVFEAANVSGTTFELKGEDSQLYGAFSSGTFEVITFGLSLSTVTNITSSGGEYEFEDMTTIHDRARTQQPTIASAVNYTLENHWGPGNAALRALRAASAVKAERAVKITFPNGDYQVFYGNVGAVGILGGSAHGKATESVSFTSLGLPTSYEA